MGGRMAMTPVCFKYWISGIMALWASAICVCWMHIWGIKVRQKYISIWYRHDTLYMFFECWLYIKPIPTITSNAQVVVPIHEICLYMDVYVCIYIYIYICIYRWAGAGGGGDMAPVRWRWRCAFLALTREIFISVYRTCLCAGAGGA